MGSGRERGREGVWGCVIDAEVGNVWHFIGRGWCFCADCTMEEGIGGASVEEGREEG